MFTRRGDSFMAWWCILLPFVAWWVSGSLKFFVNFLRAGGSLAEARRPVGYGGFPSTHTATLSSTAFFVGFTLGFDTPFFVLGLGTLIILIMDARNLRRKVGQHAAAINELRQAVGIKAPPLRARMGHSYPEIAGGLAVGAALGWAAACLA